MEAAAMVAEADTYPLADAPSAGSGFGATNTPLGSSQNRWVHSSQLV